MEHLGERCQLDPMGEYGKPYLNGILSGCEWCEFAVECFLIVGRDYEGELQAREEFAKICYTIEKEK